MVAIVHCETSSGVLNNAEEHALQIRKLQPNSTRFLALAASSNKCLEGVPGFGYAICRKSKLSLCKGKQANKIRQLCGPLSNSG